MNQDDGDQPEASGLVAAYERWRDSRDDLTPAQTAAMQSLDDALRAGEITAEDAAEIEAVIRRGHVHGARKRITQAKRRGNRAR